MGHRHFVTWLKNGCCRHTCLILFLKLHLTHKKLYFCGFKLLIETGVGWGEWSCICLHHCRPVGQPLAPRLSWPTTPIDQSHPTWPRVKNCCGKFHPKQLEDQRFFYLQCKHFGVSCQVATLVFLYILLILSHIVSLWYELVYTSGPQTRNPRCSWAKTYRSLHH